MTNMRRPCSTFEQYAEQFPAETRARLEQLRQLVRELVPAAEERISYGMPAFALDGILVWFGGHARHVGFYPGASGVAAFEAELAGYKHARGSIQFPLRDPLPLELISRIVQFRVRENRARKQKKR